MPNESKYVLVISGSVFPKEGYLHVHVCCTGYATVNCLYQCKISTAAVLTWLLSLVNS